MADVIRKVLPIEVKEISERVLEFVGSTETQDRDREVILAKGWDLKNYRKNPVFMFGHKYDQPPIGKALKVKAEDGALKFQIEFADQETYPFADTIYRLYRGGFMKATSVGFIPAEWKDKDEDDEDEKSPRRTYTKQELLELSAVAVPSNPDALVQAREAGIINTKDFDLLAKPEEAEPKPKSPANDDMSQAAIADELDYCLNILQEQAIDKDNLQLAERLALAICGLTGAGIRLEDKEDGINTKAGAVLNAKNKRNLTDAQGLIQQVLDSAEPVTESADPPVESIPQEVIAQAVVEAMKKYVQI